MSTVVFRVLVINLAIANIWAMKITGMATSTVMPTARKTSSPDPWTCVNKNVTQYFDMPKPTGALLDALVSYGEKLLEPCLATATGLDALSCSVSEASEWCGFTTVAPSNILASYSTYASAAASFWRANSDTISIVASDCPVAWSRAGLGDQIWLNDTIAYAECYIAGHTVNAPA